MTQPRSTLVSLDATPWYHGRGDPRGQARLYPWRDAADPGAAEYRSRAIHRHRRTDAAPVQQGRSTLRLARRSTLSRTAWRAMSPSCAAWVSLGRCSSGRRPDWQRRLPFRSKSRRNGYRRRRTAIICRGVVSGGGARRFQSIAMRSSDWGRSRLVTRTPARIRLPWRRSRDPSVGARIEVHVDQGGYGLAGLRK